MTGWKKLILNFLGILTTILTLTVIYFVLFMTGVIREITSAIIIEYLILLVLSLSTKAFWYASVENSVRTSDDYIKLEQTVVDTMSTTVDDSFDFDKFIYYENINNYNRYVLGKCLGLTVDNYKLSLRDRLEMFFRFITNKRKPKRFYAERYLCRVTQKATKLHKLSSANILTFSHSVNGLTDDQNGSTRSKVLYLLGGFALSAVTMLVTAAVGFEPKSSVDYKAAIIKMITYSVQIILSILQTILRANNDVKRGDTEYFRKLLNIFAKYDDYKLDPKPVKYIQLSVKEVDYAIIADETNSYSSEGSDDTSEQSRSSQD